ncbi:MAG TPA: hypothetical protein VF446_07620 [Trinickia sp.]
MVARFRFDLAPDFIAGLFSYDDSETTDFKRESGAGLAQNGVRLIGGPICHRVCAIAGASVATGLGAIHQSRAVSNNRDNECNQYSVADIAPHAYCVLTGFFPKAITMAFRRGPFRRPPCEVESPMRVTSRI